MDTNTTLKKVATDVANVQHNSDILTQWPIPSIEGMYYAGPFFVPSMMKDIASWPDDPESLFKRGLLPGKLSNMLFFFLNDKSKKQMGPVAHKFAVTTLIKKVDKVRINGETEKDINDTWIPKEWESLKAVKYHNLKKLTFLLDNLNELVNPIFRGLGTEYFFKGDMVYRYYYHLGLDFKILIVSKKAGIEIDYFEHVFSPENLEYSSLFIIENDTIREDDAVEKMEELVQQKISSLDVTDFDRMYVINNLFSAFGYKVPEPCKEFVKSPFPKEITDFYVKTCTFPVEILSKEIYRVLGGE